MSPLFLPALAVLLLVSSSLSAQTLSIDHQPVACAVAERFPQLEARFAPSGTIATARVVFQAEDAKPWYSIAMKPQGPVFSGVLPKPKKSLKAFRYYIEVTDSALGTNRTADYTTDVVASPGECKGKLMAAGLGSASVLLQVPAGAAALPAGFASTGVVATASGSVAAASGAAAGGGGGLSTGALVGIVGGAAAAAAAVVVGVSKSGDGTSYTGAFNGTLSVSYTRAGEACSNTHAMSGTLDMRLGGSDVGTFQLDGSKTQTGGSTTCPSSGSFGIQDGGSVTGTPGSLAFKALRNESGFGPGVEFSGALNGGAITGTLTFSFLAGNSVAGSVSIPVTLR